MKNIEDIMKMANDVQEQLRKAQLVLNQVQVEGMSGGGLVKVKATAKGEIQSIDIDPSLLVADGKEMLEDLIVAALNDTRAEADRMAAKQMKRFTAGMELPPGFKI